MKSRRQMFLVVLVGVGILCSIIGGITAHMHGHAHAPAYETIGGEEVHVESHVLFVPTHCHRRSQLGDKMIVSYNCTTTSSTGGQFDDCACFHHLQLLSCSCWRY
jgi:hypothetical protein